MALIKCPDCGQDVSDKAKVCIHCGCPLAEIDPSGPVRIKMPNNVSTGFASLLSAKQATVYDSRQKVLWRGKHGENASFTISEPTKITIDLGGWANPLECTVTPKRKYTLVQDLGVHMLATYRITEVDVIDSD